MYFIKIFIFHKILWIELAKREKIFLFIRQIKLPEEYMFSQACYNSANDIMIDWARSLDGLDK
jgi:hypothetical protein